MKGVEGYSENLSQSLTIVQYMHIAHTHSLGIEPHFQIYKNYNNHVPTIVLTNVIP